MLTGTIEITVMDVTGKPLENVEVTVKNDSEHFNILFHTNARGQAGMMRFVATSYDVIAEMEGYQTEKTSIQLRPEQRLRLELTLQAA